MSRAQTVWVALLTALYLCFELAFNAPTLKEFVVRDKQGKVDELIAKALEAGFLAG